MADDAGESIMAFKVILLPDALNMGPGLRGRGGRHGGAIDLIIL